MTAPVRLTPDQFPAHVEGLGELLAHIVEGGGSLGFLSGLTAAGAADWWRARTPAVESGDLVVWVALDEAGRCVGTVSLGLNHWPNGSHRAEVLKLMVHGSARGQGVARTLLATLERAAAEAGISLLVLDTETGCPAETLYRKTGWEEAGVIPDYASDPAGVLRPTTLFYKRPGAQAPSAH
ncbi:GNAT family N-acetyltransferase [Streptomyces sp. NPDC050400]|uniref:GNAT family N-acetyltransferase n=1 Tax=Streptomyces sp. NPDC050400 TaxID=3365610 RepID=UPI0037B26C6D